MSPAADPPREPGRRRLRPSDLGRMLLSWATGSLALVVASWLLPGLQASSVLDLVAVAAVVSVFGLLVRPVLASVASAIGWLAVAVVAVVGQAIVMQLVLVFVPSVEAESFWTLVAATWIASLVSTILTWLVSAGTDESFTTALLRYGRRGVTVADPEVDGIVFVQLDGLPYPVARWALQSGTMPTLRRWLDDGSHELREWTVQTPCTTPASQQGILMGTIEGVPAFRWYDRELGRVLVANRPADAAVIEARASTGRGLLADRGVSVSNLFSGDAERSMMTMSQVGLTRGSRDTRRTVARFVLRPDGFTRSFFRTLAEVARERFEARQQRRRKVVPRVVRPWTFALLRAVTNGVLRDLNTAVVAQEMLRGTPSVYVDFVDYDEVAHHAGCNRLESLGVLEALDEVLRQLETVARAAPRRYHLVVLSDHGQSQGPPFAEDGRSLAELCAALTSADVAALDASVESWGPVEALLDDLAGNRTPGAGSAARATAERTATLAGVSAGDDLVVLGSGNLGLVYAREPERLLLEDIEERWPALVPGLVADPGVGFVSVLSRDHGPVVIGRDGFRRLEDGTGEGDDPLAPFGTHAAAGMLRCTSMPSAPDLYVNSTLDTSTLEVKAFEGLVGSHGGLGGWQDSAVLVVPTALETPDDHVHGADALHRVLVGFLEQAGQRQAPWEEGLSPRGRRAEPATSPAAPPGSRTPGAGPRRPAAGRRPTPG